MSRKINRKARISTSTILKLTATAFAAQLCFSAPVARAFSYSGIFGLSSSQSQHASSAHHNDLSNRKNASSSTDSYIKGPGRFQNIKDSQNHVPFYPYLNIEMSSVTADAKNFNDSSHSGIEVNPKFLAANNDGVIIAFALGKIKDGNLVATLGGKEITPDNADDPYVKAWVNYVNAMKNQGKKVIISFGGSQNASDLAVVANNNWVSDQDKAQSQVTNAMSDLLKVFDADTKSHIAFDFDIEGPMESNIAAIKLYAKALTTLEKSKELQGFTTRNKKLIQAGVTIATLQAGPTAAGTNIMGLMSSVTNYTNLMAFDMGGNPNPEINQSVDYTKLISSFNNGSYALTFMPGDEDGAGARVFLSPEGAAQLQQKVDLKTPFISMWQFSRDLEDTTSSQSICYANNKSVVTLEESRRDCTGQLQKPFAYTDAFTGNLHQTDASTNPAYILIPKSLDGSIDLTQAKDGSGNWKEGYQSTHATLTDPTGGMLQTRMFMDTRSPSEKKKDPTPTFKSTFTSASTTSTGKITDLLSGLFQTCSATNQDAPCLARISGSEDADTTAQLLSVAQSLNNKFYVTGYHTDSKTHETLIPFTVKLPQLKNRVQQSGTKLSVQPLLATSYYSGHDLWIKKSGVAKADWGPIVYSATLTGDKGTLSSDQSSSSAYLHLIFPNDDRTKSDYISDDHDILVTGSTDNIGTINKLSINFLAKHGICDKTQNDCVNGNKPGLIAGASGQITPSTEQSKRTASFITTTPSVTSSYSTDNEAMLSWTPVASDYSGYIKYAITSANKTSFTANTSDLLTGLTPNTSYPTTVTAYYCPYLADNIASCSTTNQTEKGTFKTKTSSTANGVTAKVKVAQDKSTSKGESSYALYNVDISPADSEVNSYVKGNWPSNPDLSSGNVDTILFNMQVRNENNLPAPKCTIENTKPQIVQDNTHAHSDGLNMVFDQSWFVTSAWKSKVWSCKLTGKQVISQGGGSAITKIVKNVTDLTTYPGTVGDAAKANSYTLALNPLPKLFGTANANIKEIKITFKSTTDLNVGWGNKGPQGLENWQLSYDNSNIGEPKDGLGTMTESNNDGQYTYTLDLKLSNPFAIGSSTEQGKTARVTLTMPFNADNEGVDATAINKALKSSQMTFVSAGKPGVTEYTYLIKRNSDILPSNHNAAHPNSRFVNFPLWLDNIFRIENDNYGDLSGENSLIRLQLGFDFQTSKDPSKTSHKDDVVNEDTPYNNSMTWDTSTMPKAKAFANTDFNPLAIVPQSTTTQLPNFKVNVVMNVCKDPNNGDIHLDPTISNSYGPTGATKPLSLWFPDQYDFTDFNDGDRWTTHQDGWSISMSLNKALKGTFESGSIGGMKASYDDNKLIFTSKGAYQGLRPDQLPITGVEAIYQGNDLTADEVSDALNGKEVTWISQLRPGKTPTQQTGIVTVTHNGCGKPAQGHELTFDETKNDTDSTTLYQFKSTLPYSKTFAISETGYTSVSDCPKTSSLTVDNALSTDGVTATVSSPTFSNNECKYALTVTTPAAETALPTKGSAIKITDNSSSDTKKPTATLTVDEFDTPSINLITSSFNTGLGVQDTKHPSYGQGFIIFTPADLISQMLQGTNTKTLATSLQLKDGITTGNPLTFVTESVFGKWDNNTVFTGKTKAGYLALADFTKKGNGNNGTYTYGVFADKNVHKPGEGAGPIASDITTPAAASKDGTAHNLEIVLSDGSAITKLLNVTDDSDPTRSSGVVNVFRTSTPTPTPTKKEFVSYPLSGITIKQGDSAQFEIAESGYDATNSTCDKIVIPADTEQTITFVFGAGTIENKHCIYTGTVKADKLAKQQRFPAEVMDMIDDRVASVSFPVTVQAPTPPTPQQKTISAANTVQVKAGTPPVSFNVKESGYPQGSTECNKLQITGKEQGLNFKEGQATLSDGTCQYLFTVTATENTKASVYTATISDQTDKKVSSVPQTIQVKGADPKPPTPPAEKITFSDISVSKPKIKDEGITTLTADISGPVDCSNKGVSVKLDSGLEDGTITLTQGKDTCKLTDAGIKGSNKTTSPVISTITVTAQPNAKAPAGTKSASDTKKVTINPKAAPTPPAPPAPTSDITLTPTSGCTEWYCKYKTPADLDLGKLNNSYTCTVDKIDVSGTFNDAGAGYVGTNKDVPKRETQKDDITCTKIS